MARLAANGAAEGVWLRADSQTVGRGRHGRMWVSPPGNLYASTLVRLRPADPPGATLALVSAVALEETLTFFCRSPAKAGVQARTPGNSRSPPLASPWAPAFAGERLLIKWPNDLLLDGAKLAGILLERHGDAVVAGFGVNLAHAPDLPDRATISLVDAGLTPPEPGAVCDALADVFGRWLGIWRSAGLAPVRERWLERAHPPGTPLAVALPSGERLEGCFGGLAPDGALLLRLADGQVRAIHAADVFLV